MRNAPRNGWLMRTFPQDGHLISEIEFTIGDPGEYPRAIGYMVGEDDGRSTLYPTPEKAISEHTLAMLDRNPGEKA